MRCSQLSSTRINCDRDVYRKDILFAVSCRSRKSSSQPLPRYSMLPITTASAAWALVTFVSRIPRWLKVSVGLLLLSALISRLDWSALSGAVRTLRWPLIGAAALLYPAALLLNAAKWSAALRLHDLSFRFAYLLRTGCIGFFVNNLLPSAIGGDIYRVYKSSTAGATSQAVSAVVLERLVGLFVLLLNGIVGALLLLGSSSLARVYLIVCLSGLAVATVVAMVSVVGRSKIASTVESSQRLQPIIANLRRIARPHPAWMQLIAYSVAFQIVSAGTTFLTFLAVGADVTISRALLITVAAGLAAVLPISISGIGIVEGSTVGAGIALGVDYDSAFLAAIVLRALSLATSLGCGIVYAFEGHRRSISPLDVSV
jgi:glycosyltransferase 2 family protein